MGVSQGCGDVGSLGSVNGNNLEDVSLVPWLCQFKVLHGIPEELKKKKQEEEKAKKITSDLCPP